LVTNNDYDRGRLFHGDQISFKTDVKTEAINVSVYMDEIPPTSSNLKSVWIRHPLFNSYSNKVNPNAF